MSGPEQKYPVLAVFISHSYYLSFHAELSTPLRGWTGLWIQLPPLRSPTLRQMTGPGATSPPRSAP